LAALISVSLVLSQTSVYTASHEYGASASRRVSVYVAAFPGTHCAYQCTEGWPGWVDLGGWLHTRLQTATHPSTNRARRWLTSLMWLHS